MISLDDAKLLRGTRVRYDWKPIVWEPCYDERAIILGTGAKRIRILHLNAPGLGDVAKWVDPRNLYEISES